MNIHICLNVLKLSMWDNYKVHVYSVQCVCSAITRKWKRQPVAHTEV